MAPTDEVREYVLADLDHSQAKDVMKVIAHSCGKAVESLRKTIGEECLPVFLKIRVASEENLDGVLNLLGEESTEICAGLHAQMLAKTVDIAGFNSDVSIARSLQRYLTKLRHDLSIAEPLVFCGSLIS